LRTKYPKSIASSSYKVDLRSDVVRPTGVSNDHDPAEQHWTTLSLLALAPCPKLQAIAYELIALTTVLIQYNRAIKSST